MTAPDRPTLELDQVRADAHVLTAYGYRLIGERTRERLAEAVPALLAHIDQLERRLDVALRFAMTPADEETNFCPECSGLVRMTVGMVCPVCRTDYGPTPDPGGVVVIAGRGMPEGYDPPSGSLVDPGGLGPGNYADDVRTAHPFDLAPDTDHCRRCGHGRLAAQHGTYAVDDQQEGS